MESQKWSLSGYTNSRIAYDNVTEGWKIEVLTDPDKFATTNAKLPPFGVREYHLSDGLGGGNVTLNINACDDETEYDCNDGICIPIGERCDSKFDCLDHSDESACQVIDVPTSYLRHVPAGKIKFLQINIK